MSDKQFTYILPVHQLEQYWQSQLDMHGKLDQKQVEEVLRFKAALFYYDSIRTNKLIDMWHQTRGKREHKDITNVLTYRLIHQTDLGLDK